MSDHEDEDNINGGDNHNQLANDDEVAEQHQRIARAAQNHKLPEDLIVEILLRLPLQNLVQMRCASFGIKALVQSSSFCKLHLTRCSSNMTLLAYPAKDVWKFSPYERCTEPDFHMRERHGYAFNVEFKEKTDPIVSCNGIICLGTTSILPPNKSELQLTFLNPATRDFSDPSPKLVFPYGADSRIHVAFGFVASDNIHKVMVTHEIVGWACVLYYMESREWRAIADFPGIPCGGMDDPYGKFMTKNVHINGTLNWLSRNEYNTRFWIVSLDLSTERFNEILLPTNVIITDADNEGVRIGRLGDDVSFCYVVNQTIIVWRLQDKKWKKLAEIGMEVLPSVTDINPKAFKIFNIFETLGVIVIQNFGRLFKPRRNFIYYNYLSNELAGFHSVRFEGEPQGAAAIWVDEVNYVRSLFAPK